MKVIFSRKGSDGGNLKNPSPILEGKSLTSIPIPAVGTESTNLKYGNLFFDQDTKLDRLMTDLKFQLASGKSISTAPAHLDPDIRKDTLKRDGKWRGLFGSDLKWEKYLQKTNVKEGDIFLFYGWFREVKKTSEGFDWLYLEKTSYPTDKQLIFGYLQIGKILRKGDKFEQWMEYHPHYEESGIVSNGYALYVAAESLSFDKRRSGFGTFVYDKESAGFLTLTKKGLSRSRWDLPSFFKDHILINFKHDPWANGYFQSPMRGQEMVVDDCSEINRWIENLFKSVKTEN